MCTKILLNPAKESETINEMTNEEICWAVQKVRKAQELAEVNGSNDDKDDNAPIEEILCCCEVLKTMSIIGKYINMVDDLTAQKLEALLHLFGWKLKRTWKLLQSLIISSAPR
jgi:hypothetical protein